MNVALTLTMLLVSVMPAYAQTRATEADIALAEEAHRQTIQEATDRECAKLGEVAIVVMNARQRGDSLSSLIATIPKARPLIMLSFDEPRWATDAEQDRAKEDFRNEVELGCYKTSADSYIEFD